jgi:hypothetical protein
MIHKYIIQSNQTLQYLEKAREGQIAQASRFGIPEIDDYLRFKKSKIS